MGKAKQMQKELDIIESSDSGDDDALLKDIISKPSKKRSQVSPNVKVSKVKRMKIKAEVKVEEGSQDGVYITKSRTRSLIAIISNMTKEQQDAVKEIGFGGLLYLKIRQISQAILSDLITAFDRNTCTLKFSNEKSFPLTKYDVQDVFGLPTGPNPIKLMLTGPRSGLLNEDVKNFWRKKLGLEKEKDNGQEEAGKKGTGKNVVGKNETEKKETGKKDFSIPLTIVQNRLENCKTSGDYFKQLFVLYSMSYFLAPTSNSEVDIRLLKILQNASDIPQLDWCSHVLTEVVLATKRPFPRNMKGCMLFLMLTYFHRFNVKELPISNELPLIKNWNDSSLWERICHEREAGELGISPVSDVAFPISNSVGSERETMKSNIPKSEERYIRMKCPENILTDEEIEKKATDVSWCS